MSSTRPIGSSRWPSHFGGFFVAVLTTVVCALPSVAQAGPITLRFNGTADLTGFDGSPASVFAGSVTWDPDTEWEPVGVCPRGDFCLDGSPGAVSATFAIDSADYTDRIDPTSPFSRFIIWGFGGVSLDLHFTPAIDFDGGIAPDVSVVSLNMFSDPVDYSLLIDSQLPDDIAFLRHLTDRYLVFSDQLFAGGCEEPCVRATTLSVVPEPSSTALLLLGLSVACWSTRRRRPA